MKEAETWYCKSSVEVFSEGIASVVLETQELKGYGEGWNFLCTVWKGQISWRSSWGHWCWCSLSCRGNPCLLEICFVLCGVGLSFSVKLYVAYSRASKFNPPMLFGIQNIIGARCQTVNYQTEYSAWFWFCLNVIAFFMLFLTFGGKKALFNYLFVHLFIYSYWK